MSFRKRLTRFRIIVLGRRTFRLMIVIAGALMGLAISALVLQAGFTDGLLETSVVVIAIPISSAVIFVLAERPFFDRFALVPPIRKSGFVPESDFPLTRRDLLRRLRDACGGDPRLKIATYHGVDVAAIDVLATHFGARFTEDFDPKGVATFKERKRQNSTPFMRRFVEGTVDLNSGRPTDAFGQQDFSRYTDENGIELKNEKTLLISNLFVDEKSRKLAFEWQRTSYFPKWILSRYLDWKFRSEPCSPRTLLQAFLPNMSEGEYSVLEKVPATLAVEVAAISKEGQLVILERSAKEATEQRRYVATVSGAFEIQTVEGDPSGVLEAGAIWETERELVEHSEIQAGAVLELRLLTCLYFLSTNTFSFVFGMRLNKTLQEIRRSVLEDRGLPEEWEFGDSFLSYPIDQVVGESGAWRNFFDMHKGHLSDSDRLIGVLYSLQKYWRPNPTH